MSAAVIASVIFVIALLGLIFMLGFFTACLICTAPVTRRASRSSINTRAKREEVSLRREAEAAKAAMLYEAVRHSFNRRK